MEINYISIYDCTPEAKFLFISDSIKDVLGYSPKELIGTCGYDLTHPSERQAINSIHSYNVTNENMSSSITYRSKHKNGHYVDCDIVIHYCHDFIVCTNFAVIDSNSAKHKMRTLSVDTSYLIEQDGALCLSFGSQDKLKEVLRHQFPLETKPEPRFCLFLNRFTTQSTIVFATHLCQDMVGLDQVGCLGTSLYDYVAEKDIKQVMHQIELAKSKDLVIRIRFNWISSEKQLFPLEAIVSCTLDGLVFVARASPIFCK